MDAIKFGFFSRGNLLQTNSADDIYLIAKKYADKMHTDIDIYKFVTISDDYGLTLTTKKLYCTVWAI